MSLVVHVVGCNLMPITKVLAKLFHQFQKKVDEVILVQHFYIKPHPFLQQNPKVDIMYIPF